MVAQIWKLLLEKIVSVLWPIVEEFVIEAARELLKWLMAKLDGLFRKQANAQTEFAEQKSRDAARASAEATDNAGRVRAEAEAKVWKEVAEELKFQNASLQQRLNELMKEASEYSTSQAESESAKERLQDRILKLSPPTGISI